MTNKVDARDALSHQRQDSDAHSAHDSFQLPHWVPSLAKLELWYRAAYPYICKWGFLAGGASYLFHLVWWKQNHPLWFLGLAIVLFFSFRLKQALAPHMVRTHIFWQLFIGNIMVPLPWAMGSWMAFEPASAVITMLLTVLGYRFYMRFTKPRDFHVSGAKAMDPNLCFKEHHEKIKTKIAKGQHPAEFLNFMGMGLTTVEATTHFLLLGETRSGKSLVMSMMLPVLRYQDKRALIYDYANNFYAKLLAVGIESERIINLNPFHTECYEWLLSKDLTNESICYTVALGFFPASNDKEKFFADYAARITAAVMKTLNRAAREAGIDPVWGLKELCYFCSSRKKLNQLLQTFEDIGDEFEEMQNGGDQAMGGVSTLQNTFELLKPVAECQYRARQLGRTISLKQFPDSNHIILLGRDEEKGKQQLNFYNGAVISFCTGQIIGRPTDDNTKPASTFIIADEFQSLGRINKLPTITTEGGKYGFSAILATQSQHNLQGIYQETELASMLGSVTHLASLKVSEGKTAEWLSKQFGDTTIMEPSFSSSRGRDGTKTDGTTYTKKTKPLFSPGVFQALPKIDMQDSGSPMGVIVRCDDYVYQMNLSRKVLIDMLPPKPTPEMERLNVAPQDDSVLNFSPLNDGDFQRLGLSHLTKQDVGATTQDSIEDDDFSLDIEAIRFD